MSAPLLRSFALLSLRSTSYQTPRAMQAVASSSRIGGFAAVQRPALKGVRTYASEAGSSLGLGNLSPAQRTKNRKRLGRGPSSGRGGTSTRGHKGQKARRGNGKPTPGFAGGQTPLTRRYPKRGFTNIHAKKFVAVNLDRLQHWIDRGLIDPAEPITAKELYESNCVHRVGDGVKLLGDGAEYLRTPLRLVVSRASASAIAAIEAVGGSVECRYYNALSLQALLKPHKFEGKLLPRPADPLSKREILYYSSPAKRGYLAKRATASSASSASVSEDASR